MQISDAQSGMIYGFARGSTAAQDEIGQVRQLEAAGCEKVFREKITGITADRPQLAKLMKALAPGDVVITPAVDRLSRETTDLLVIARDMQRAGAGIRSLAEPFLDTTSDFAEIIFAILGVAAKLERRRIWSAPRASGPTPKPTASSSAACRSSPRVSRRRPASASKRARRSAAWPAGTMSVRARFPGCKHEFN
jgi:Resolvase, N terminal domain